MKFFTLKLDAMYDLYKRYRPAGQMDEEEIVDAIKSGEYKGFDIEKTIEQYRSTGEDKYKKSLPAVTLCGVFNGRRTDDNIQSYEPNCRLDFDKVDDPEALISKLKGDPFIRVAFISPGGGVKAIVRMDSTVENHSEACRRVIKYYEDKYGYELDKSVTDLPRLMFLSYDPNCYYNSDAEVFRIQEVVENPVRGTGNDYKRLKQPDCVSDDEFIGCQKIHDGLSRKSSYVKGNRNIHVHKFASMLNSFGVDKETAEAIILENFDLRRKELHDCIKSAYKRESQFGQFRHSPTSPASTRQEFSATPLIPLSVYDNLPPILRASTLVEEGRSRDVFLISLLVTLSGALPDVSGRYDMSRLFPHLFCLIIAPPASGKGSMNLVRHVQHRYQQYLGNLYEEALKQYKMDKANSTDSDSEEPDKPIPKYFLIAANSSSAALIKRISHNNGEGVLYASEADTLSAANKQTWGNLDHWLRSIFHHESIGVERKEEWHYIDNPKLAVLLSGTPDQLKTLIQSKENGLFSRFMMYIFEGEPEFKNQRPKNSTIVEQLENLGFHEFLDYKRDYPFDFKFSDKQWDAHAKFFQDKLEELGMVDGIRDALVRMGIIFFRITMILTAIRRWESNTRDDEAFCSTIDFGIAQDLCSVLLL